jgi:hypothetical protein
VQGNEITLKYKEGEKKIVVVPETVIVTYVPGDKSELKPGSKIFIAAANTKDDGTLEAAAISVGPTASRRRCEMAEKCCRSRLVKNPVRRGQPRPVVLTRRVGVLPLKSAAVLPSGCGGIR